MNDMKILFVIVGMMICISSCNRRIHSVVRPAPGSEISYSGACLAYCGQVPKTDYSPLRSYLVVMDVNSRKRESCEISNISFSAQVFDDCVLVFSVDGNVQGYTSAAKKISGLKYDMKGGAFMSACKIRDSGVFAVLAIEASGGRVVQIMNVDDKGMYVVRSVPVNHGGRLVCVGDNLWLVGDDESTEIQVSL